MIPRIVISAAGTGAGKTLTALALCAALRRSGRRIAPYKIGPDYIDAGFYERVAGRPAYNVDLWLDGEDGVRCGVDASLGDADAAVFEGMMGLHDGADDGTGSTAAVAALLGAAVVIVLDGWTASQTLAAVGAGLRAYDPRVTVAGVVLNRAGGAAHDAAVRAACARAGLAVIGTIAYDPALQAADRRLGLDPHDVERRHDAVERLADVIGATWDLDALAPRATPGAARPLPVAAPRARIAYAHDRALWFTYAETLAALRAAGAETIPFSPLDDRALPACDGVWLGGGYPELHAAALAANAPMRAAVREAVAAGMPAYAECGGLMYLAQTLLTPEGEFPMCGAVAGSTSMREPRLRIGYRTATACADTPLDPRGTAVRAYEYHYADGAIDAGPPPAYRLDDGSFEGISLPNGTASFLHRHFLPGSPAIERFVTACARFGQA